MVNKYFEMLGVDIESDFEKSDLTKKYKELSELVKTSRLPVGEITETDSKEWFLFRIMNLVHESDDKTLKEIYDELENSIFAAIKNTEPIPIGNDKCFLKSDSSIATFSNREELEKYFEFRKQNDIWVKPYVFECKTLGIERSLGDMTALISSQISEKLQAENLPACKEELIETAAKTDGLLVAIPVNRNLENKYEIYPIRYTAFSDLCERAGLSGSRTIKLDEKKGLISPLPCEEKAMWLTRGCSLNEESCNILIRDEKIANMKSYKYAIINEWEAAEELEKVLLANWPKYRFLSGSVSHEYLIVDYMLNDIGMEEALQLSLEKYGVTLTQPLRAGVRYTTSNIGNSCVTAAPYIYLNGTIVRLGTPIAVKHENKNTTETFANELTRIAASLHEAKDIVEALGNTDIQHIAGCIQHLAKSDEYKNLLPIVATKKLLEKLTILGDTSGTAIDVYLSLSEIVDIQNNIKQMSPTQLIKLTESVAELMYVNYLNFDQPYETE